MICSHFISGRAAKITKTKILLALRRYFINSVSQSWVQDAIKGRFAIVPRGS